LRYCNISSKIETADPTELSTKMSVPPTIPMSRAMMQSLKAHNDEEARQLSGQYSLAKSYKVIKEMGPKYLIIKKGEHGALLFHGDNVFSAPGLPLEEVFDPTGAGDTFAGGFMGYLAKYDDVSFENMERAIIYGSAMASFCVEKFGPNRLLELNKELITERVGKFINLSSFRNIELD
jgi:sugar/nucleoside kinase (ribokinase family)